MLPPGKASDALGECSLGQVLYQNVSQFPLYVRFDDLVRHCGIFASSGAGKSNVSYCLLLSFLEARIPFLVIDWKRSYRHLTAMPGKNIDTVEIYTVGRDAAPFNWNPLRPPPGVHPRAWISILADTLESTHLSGQGVADLFIDLFDKAFDKRGFYEGKSQQYPNFHDVLDELAVMKMSGRRSLWRDSCLRILRTFSFGPWESAFNSRDPVKLEEILQRPIILELDQQMPRNIRSFFSQAFVRWIHLYRLGQGESQTLRHVLVLEEAHNILQKPQYGSSDNNGWETLFREIRSYGEGLIVITQHPSQMPISVLGNTQVLIFLSLTHEADIMAARESLFLNRVDEVYLDRLKIGEAIVKIKQRVPACHVRFPFIPVPIGKVTDDTLRMKK